MTIPGISRLYQWANREPVKENIKWCVSLPSLFGFMGTFDVIRSFKNFLENKEIRNDKTDKELSDRRIWFTRFLGNTSIFLSASISPIGRKIFEEITPERAAQYFGPNVNFATNPWHPRHVASFIALGCGVTNYVLNYNLPKNEQQEWEIKALVVWNMVTCRPTQHLANQLFRKVFKN